MCSAAQAGGAAEEELAAFDEELRARKDEEDLGGEDCGPLSEAEIKLSCLLLSACGPSEDEALHSAKFRLLFMFTS